MDAKTFSKKYGSGEYARGVVAAAGTTWAYWRHIVSAQKRPSPDLARRLCEASQGEMTVDELLIPAEQVRSSIRFAKQNGQEGPKSGRQAPETVAPMPGHVPAVKKAQKPARRRAATANA